jgi:curli production assembly/transport component CsgG
MKKVIFPILIGLLLPGCAMVQSTGLTESRPEVTKVMMKKEFDTLPPPANNKTVSVAVYSFQDKTGQRRPQANVASLSTAVTQGAETFLIQALQGVGKGQWFDVVERVGVDNLVKERTIIKQMRESYEGKDAKPLMPMQFAGLIMEGGIVGYDTSTTSGGAGVRIFGIGNQTQWSTDTVTVSLRAVSVNTGKVLVSVTVQKTILSTADSATALKFFDQGTQSFEAEAGLTINEPGTYAVKGAVEMAVVELIKEGAMKGIWDFRYPLVESKKYLIGGGGFEPEPKKAEEPKIEEKKEEPVVKIEDKKEEPVAKVDLKPVATAQGLKVTPLFGQRRLKEDAYLYAEANTSSTKKWQFKKGTEVKVVQPGSEGWLRVIDSESRGGWIRTEVLEEKGKKDVTIN